MFEASNNGGLFLINASSEELVGGKGDSAWDIFDRLFRELHNPEQKNSQMQLTLEAVRKGIHADVVFYYPGKSQDAVERVGDRTISREWCRGFAAAFLEENPEAESHLLQSRLSWGSRFTVHGREPRSVVMARTSKSRSAWIVAISFQPGRSFAATDVKILILAKRMLWSYRHAAVSEGKLRETIHGLVRCLTAAIDAKDSYTSGHSERVARIATRLGREMGLDSAFLSDVYLGGLLHDIGKIGIQDSVLLKETPLTPEERNHLQEHAAIGDRMIATVRQLQHIRPAVRSHHERYDGAGYPDRLGGQEIPLLARVMAVADSCDAMMMARPYRPALPISELEAVMINERGKQWDPEIVDCFMACRQELYPICQKGIGDSIYLAVDRAARLGADETMMVLGR